MQPPTIFITPAIAIRIAGDWCMVSSGVLDGVPIRLPSVDMPCVWAAYAFWPFCQPYDTS